jgi:hypothetical protein
MLLRYVLVGRVGMLILSAIVANVAWDWMIDRGGLLWRMEWPQLDGYGLASLARWVAGVLLVGGVSYLARRLRLAQQSTPPPVPATALGDLDDSERRRRSEAASSMANPLRRWGGERSTARIWGRRDEIT